MDFVNVSVAATHQRISRVDSHFDKCKWPCAVSFVFEDSANCKVFLASDQFVLDNTQVVRDNDSSALNDCPLFFDQLIRDDDRQDTQCEARACGKRDKHVLENCIHNFLYVTRIEGLVWVSSRRSTVYRLDGWFRLRSQPVDATHSAKRSAGVLNCNVSLGRPFSRFATAFNLF